MIKYLITIILVMAIFFIAMIIYGAIMRPQWYIRRFLRKKAIRVQIHKPDRRIITRWIIPERNGFFTLDNQTYRCDTTKDDYFALVDGVPLFIYKSGVVEPIRCDDATVKHVTADELNTVINNSVVEKIFASADGSADYGKITLVVCIILIAGLAAVAFYLTKRIEALEAVITELREAFRAVTGQ